MCFTVCGREITEDRKISYSCHECIAHEFVVLQRLLRATCNTDGSVSRQHAGSDDQFIKSIDHLIKIRVSRSREKELAVH